MASALALWRDRRGHLSWLRVATLAILTWPAALMAFDLARGGLGSRPLNEVIHRTGWWALIFLLASLAITPLRRATHFARLIDVRRMIGVGCFVYAAGHLGLYVADQGFSLAKVASEIAFRLYLTIGFVAWLALALLATTSNDTMVRRIGGMNWRRLHQITYGLTILALIHYFQQTKADVSVPTLYAGLFTLLIGYRVLGRIRGEGGIGPLALSLLSVVVVGLVLLGEAIGVGLAFGQPLTDFVPQFLGMAFDTSLGIRPAWWVLAAGLAVAGVDVVMGRVRPVPARSEGTIRAAPSRFVELAQPSARR